MESLEVVLEKAPHQYTQEEKAALAEHKNEMYRQLLANMSPADLSHEVKDTLDALRAKGLLLAIGSSSKNAPFILDRIGLGDYFDKISDGNNISHSKPHPEVFLLAAEYLGLAPADCLVVEDAVSGVDAGIAGGFDTAAIPQEKLDIWHGPMADPALATPVERRNDFLEEGKVALEVGFTVAPNGTGFVANSTFMPGVTPEMFLWWFAWHCVGPDLRYKIWDRDDHLQARAIQADYVRDPAVPWAEKTWGVTHDIMEDIGLGMERLLLQFCKPADLGYDMSKIGTSACAAMVCAVGKSSSPALMTHKVVPAEGGVWFKSHFWMGYGLDGDGQLVKLVPDGQAVPEMVPRALFGHNIKEFSNLAAILPSLYAEERARL